MAESAESRDDALLNALARLNRALDGLGKAVDHAATDTAQGRDADEVAHIMSQDRAALARDLDASEARAKRLAEVNGEVSRRLLGAMETVRGVLDRQPSN
ncbi:MAG: DUF4164 family protein [Pseudomonadota bacterium]